MKEGAVVLTPLPQVDGQTKARPALLLRRLPPFGDFLVCGITTQTRSLVTGFDDLIQPGDPDFADSGLVAKSLIRLGFLATLPRLRIAGAIGRISSRRHQRLLTRLSRHLAEDASPT